MTLRMWKGLIVLLAAASGCSSPAIRTADTLPAHEDIETVEEQNLEERAFTPQEISTAVTAALTELNYQERFEQRIQSPEYLSNPFHAGKREGTIYASREEGLRRLQELAAEPILPFESHYFFDGEMWINAGDETNITIESTGKLDPLIYVTSSSKTSLQGMQKIAEHFNSGLFAHNHPVRAMLTMGEAVRERSFALLGLPLPQRHLNTNALGLPSPQDVFVYTLLNAAYPQKEYAFCVCTETSRVFFSLEQKYLQELRALPEERARAKARSDAQLYFTLFEELTKSQRSLGECIEYLNQKFSSWNIGLQFSAEDKRSR